MNGVLPLILKGGLVQTGWPPGPRSRDADQNCQLRQQPESLLHDCGAAATAPRLRGILPPGEVATAVGLRAGLFKKGLQINAFHFSLALLTRPET